MRVAIVMNTASGVRTRRVPLIRFLQSLGHHVTIVCSLDLPIRELHRMSVSYASWRVSRRNLNLFDEARSVVRIGQILGRLKPDIVLCFTLKGILYTSVAARVTPNSRLFSVFAGLGFLFGDARWPFTFLSRILHFALRIALRNNRIAFFQNEHDRDFFVSKRILPLQKNSSSIREWSRHIEIQTRSATLRPIRHCLYHDLPFAHVERRSGVHSCRVDFETRWIPR